MSKRIFVELDGALRRRVEALIENLIDLCDQLDGDANLEPNDEDEEDDAREDDRRCSMIGAE
ncbi:MAG: hypothetical protein ACR650_00190 [Methylocystis sp.]